MMAPAEVGAALAAMRKPDPEVLREAMGEADTLLESVLPLLERAAEGVLLTLPDERLVFYGLHVLAAAGRSEVYQPLIRLLRQPEADFYRLLGESAAGIVISVFDGDAAAMIAAIENPEGGDLARRFLFDALARLCADGTISREAVRELVIRFDDERLAGPASLAWLGWQNAVALLGFADLTDRVRASWEDERNPLTETERQDWEDTLTLGTCDPADKRRFEKHGIVPIDDPATALEEMDHRGTIDIAVPATDPLGRVALGADELDWLDNFLSSPKVPEDALGLEEIDGLFAAVISGPATVAPSEAFATVWGGAGQSPDFDGPEQGQYVLDLLTRHWNVIAARFERRLPHQPLIIDFGEEEYGRAWGRGFMRGMLMRFEQWRPLFDDKKDGVALMPILVLGKAREDDDEPGEDEADELAALSDDDAEYDGEEGEDWDQDEGEAEDEDWEEEAGAPDLRSELVMTLPSCVERIQRFWRQRAGPSATTPAARRKIGRNELCPCGSGKKYKRCCGA
jgi:yecA family protein